MTALALDPTTRSWQRRPAPGGHRPHGDPVTHVDHEPPDDDYPEPSASVTPIRRIPHHNLDAERSLLGALLLEPEQAERLADHVDPDDFYEPKHETVWNAIQTTRTRQGVPPEPSLVLDHLHATGDLATVSGPFLHELMQACTNPSTAEVNAQIVRNAARARALGNVGLRLTALADNATPDNLTNMLADGVQALDDAAARFGPRHVAAIRVPTIDELLAGEDEDYDWVIPGLLEHQERVIITAAEGAGKSTLLRQFAVMVASGIHPFTGEAITPQRVLHVDVENSRRQSRRQYRPLRLKAGHHLDPDRLRIEIRVQGLDLTTPADVDWLNHTVTAAAPDLLVIGPIYKLANGDPTEEKSSKPVAMALDRIRAESDCGLMLEAHSAKAASATPKKRPHEPYGWSGWMRWPEVGIYLDEDGTLRHWRGAREEREWPEKLRRGGDWPWSSEGTPEEFLWSRVRDARIRARRRLSIREVADHLDVDRNKVQRLLAAGSQYGSRWNVFNGQIHPNDEGA